MKYILDIQPDKASLAEELFGSLSFVRGYSLLQAEASAEKTACTASKPFDNPPEKNPVPVSLVELKGMLFEY